MYTIGKQISSSGSTWIHGRGAYTLVTGGGHPVAGFQVQQTGEICLQIHGSFGSSRCFVGSVHSDLFLSSPEAHLFLQDQDGGHSDDHRHCLGLAQINVVCKPGRTPDRRSKGTARSLG